MKYLLTLLLVTFIFSPVAAEMTTGDLPQSGWNFTIGAGLIAAPAFVGAKDYQLMAFPDFRVRYKDRFFASMKEGVGYNLIQDGAWRMGTVARYDFGRDEDGKNPFRIAGKESDSLRGLGDVDPTFELGGFVEYRLKPFTYKVELQQGVDGPRGFSGKTSIRYGGKIIHNGPPIIYAFGPHASFADSNYHNAYFGINQSQALRSGLQSYHAGSGITSYGFGGFAMLPITGALSLITFAGYDRLASEAGHSPLIQERGSKNQLISGLNLSYQF